MPYTTPNSEIDYFGDLGIDPSHSNSLYFSNEQEKTDYFDRLAYSKEQNASYVSNDKPFIRSSLPMSTLYNKTYMRFKNKEFEKKWFYAFIDKVVYANNGMTEVWYTIDPVMTWMGVFELAQCFVERETTATDEIGEHLIEEGLPTGDYVIQDNERIFAGGDLNLVVSTSSVISTGEEQQVEAADPTLYKGFMLSGAKYELFTVDTEGRDALREYVNKLVDDNKVDSIISMHIVPERMIPSEAQGGLALTPSNWSSNHTLEHAFPSLSGTDYTPKNKKLYTYPYCLMVAHNGEGSANEFRYEMFADATASFYWFGVCFDVAEAALIPRNYRKLGIDMDFTEMLVMRQFPQASISIDQYKAWVAQMDSGGWEKIAGSAVSTAIGSFIASGGNIPAAVAGGITSGIGGVIGAMSESTKYKSLPDAVIGTANTNIMSGINQKHFFLEHKMITAEYAKIIDEFFTMFGYKVNRVKTPPMSNRDHFTYVKTRDCQVHGNLPAPDARAIEQCFDKGIRFWKDHTEIGNYSVDNSAS